MTKKITYRVIPMTRYFIVRWSEEGSAKIDEVKGEFDSRADAYEAAYALAKADHERLQYPPGDERIVYPERPQGEAVDHAFVAYLDEMGRSNGPKRQMTSSEDQMVRMVGSPQTFTVGYRSGTYGDIVERNVDALGFDIGDEGRLQLFDGCRYYCASFDPSAWAYILPKTS